MYSNGASADVVGSPSAVGQAIDVLLTNALVHGGGAIRVDVTAEDGALCVTVADQGAGIAEEARARLFARNPDEQGHGIGLALARTLIETEGGRLDLVQPRPPVFEFILPVDRAHFS